MKLKKAIEIQTDYINDPISFSSIDLPDAMKLVIEAGKRLENMRLSPCTTADELLPGETED